MNLIERLDESGATNDSQSTTRSGSEACLARNLNGSDGPDEAPPGQSWVLEWTGRLAQFKSLYSITEQFFQ